MGEKNEFGTPFFDGHAASEVPAATANHVRINAARSRIESLASTPQTEGPIERVRRLGLTGARPEGLKESKDLIPTQERIVAGTTVTDEALRVLCAGRALTHAQKGVDLDLVGLLLGVLVNPGRTGHWFSRFIQNARVNFGRWPNVDSEWAKRVEREIATPSAQPPMNVSPSVRMLLERASLFASGPPVDVDHLIASVIYASDSATELESVGLHRQAWSNSFLAQFAGPSPAVLQYRELHKKLFEEEPLNAPLPRIVDDRWTHQDSLDYDVFAYAIYRFLVHPSTTPPLSIGIHAPWGAGKTSLMRMVKERLDAEAPLHQARVHSPLKTGEALALLEGRLRVGQPTATRKIVTVWFNAWKYASSSQVWAGLADAIIEQVAEQVPDRERFFLLLNAKRINVTEVRSAVYQRSLQFFWNAGTAVLAAIAASLPALALIGSDPQPRWWLSGPLGCLAAVYRLWTAKKKAKDEPAAPTLKDYLKVPNYRQEVGFVHQVDEDLQKVIAAVPDRAVVVFIDDLDRCPPMKVAEVFEGINLFLASDHLRCSFVLAMDPDLVAAALEVAHKSVLEKADPSGSMALGWRFMDKFVQLPFTIPAPQPEDLARFTEVIAGLPPLPTAEKESAPIPRAESKVLDLRWARPDARLTRETIDMGLARFDDDPNVRMQILAAARTFSQNPRAIKRFVNVFRFHYCIWWTLSARGDRDLPTVAQLQRWLVLLMRWPEVARFVRSVPRGDEQRGMEIAKERLGIFEAAGEVAEEVDFERWREGVSRALRFEKPPSWLCEQFRAFCQQEATYPRGARLSNGVGRGLW